MKRQQVNRWSVCIASFVVQFAVFGIQNSYGILFVSLREEFHSSEMSTAWIGTLSFTLMFFMGPVMTKLCHNVGCHVLTFAGSLLIALGLFTSSYANDIRILFITYGLGIGIGTSMAFYSAICILNIHFKKRLSLAYGISMSGAGFGVPVISKLSHYIITTSDWRSMLRILSSTGPLLFLCGLVYFTLTNNRQDDKQETVAKNKKVSLPWKCQALRLLKVMFDYQMFAHNKAFRMWALALSLILSGLLVPLIFLIRIADNIGVPRSQSSLLIGYMAITQTFSKLVFGKIGDISADMRITVLQISSLVCAINITLCPLVNNYAFLVVFVVIFGICDGCFAVIIPMGTDFIVGRKDMARAFGNVCCVVSAVQLIVTPLAGLMYDAFDEYSIAFFAAGGLMTSGVCVMFLVPLYLLQQKISKACLPEHNPLSEKENTLHGKYPSEFDKCGKSSNCITFSDFTNLPECSRTSIDWV